MKILNLFGKSVVSIAVLTAFNGAWAAAPGRTGGVSGSSSARMPTMPVVSLNTIGNPAVNTVNQPSGVSGGLPTIKPNQPDNPNNPNKPDKPDDPNKKPDNPPAPSKCPDGGVENSTYTVSMCMNDILQCVNTGALQGGLNDLFNSDVRNSIMNGMKLCQSAVDKCIREVRIDCRNIYAASTDVWLDFNSRVIQPEYYNFVLRKTGLTPNQAENTCLLLDRNTYGESFAAVSDRNDVNTEYNKRVGAYNEARGGSLSKNNPQGVEVNTTGYDGNRGHYARWDASKAECLVRVAAYNKDNLITNSWLFGVVGDDTPAEVWQKTGTTFTCNKDLFDMSLLNKTKTTAAVAVPGGAVLGAAIGAGAGAAAYNKKVGALDDLYADPCDDEMYLKKLGRAIGSKYMVFEAYLCNDVSVTGEEASKYEVKCNSSVKVDPNNLSLEACKAIHDLFAKKELYRAALDNCEIHKVSEIENRIVGTVCVNGELLCKDNGNIVKGDQLFRELNLYDSYEVYKNKCLFKPLMLLSGLGEKEDPLCNDHKTCITHAATQKELSKLESALASIESVINKDFLAKTKQINQTEKSSKGKQVAKGAAIGALTGAGAGGVVTAITAWVEKNNIACKVGDGLNTVSLGKSHTIDSLKDFYVKWNLHLPDTVSPTSVVSDEASWQQACSQFNSRLMDCPSVQVNLKKGNDYTLVAGACTISGSMCIANKSVMASHLNSSSVSVTFTGQTPTGPATGIVNPVVVAK